LIKAVEDSNIFVQHFSGIIDRIKCENECCVIYRIIEAADWLSPMKQSTETYERKEINRMAGELYWYLDRNRVA